MSDDALSEFLDAYDDYRIKDQELYYAKRLKEYVAADRQAGSLVEVLLFLAGVSGVVAAAWPTYALWLGVLAASLAAIATVVGGWAELIGFSKNAHLFRATADSLAFARPKRPEGSETQQTDASVYLTRMEDILLGEVHSWGKEWGQADDPPPAAD